MSTEPPDDQNQDQARQPPTKKRSGRPRKWPKERRIKPIYEGRMSFQPGEPHPMDAQLEQARNLREEIRAELAELQSLMINLGVLDDASETISREEQAVTALLWDLYQGRKHRDHLVATFIAARRRRLLQRLQATRAALEQARQFLSADMDILLRLQQAIADAETSALALHGPPPPRPVHPTAADVIQEEEEQSGRELEDDIQEEGVGEVDAVPDQGEHEETDEAGMVSDQGKQEEEKQAKERKARENLMRAVGGGDDATVTREALADFEARVRTMRSAIVDGQGWFEWYYVKRPKRKRYTQEAKAYLERDEEVPEDVEMYVEEEDDRPPWGPYLRYRMYEGDVQITMGMGHIRRRNLQGPSDPPKL